MKTQALDFGKKFWNDFRGFPKGQQAVIAIALFALVAGGLFYMSWSPSPSYAPLYTNLASSDASSIVDKLNSTNTPYKLSAAGTEILVPQDKVYETRLAISAAGLPSSNQSGYSLLDKEGVTTSQFKQQVDYQRAIEGELARTIQSINGVSSASVHIAVPQQDVFNDGSQKTTAAVLLTLNNGLQLTQQQVQSVVYLVSSAVPNLDAKNVTVADSNGNVLSAAGTGVTDATSTASQVQATQNYNNTVAAALQAMIDKTTGVGHSVVTVNADLNFDKTNTTTKNYNYTPGQPPLSINKSTETYTGNNAGGGGTLGAGTPSTGPSASSSAGNYKKTSVIEDNPLGTTTTVTANAPGTVRKLSVAVLLDSSVKNLNLAAINTLVKSATGLNSTRGDSLAIQALPFTKTATTPGTASAAAKSGNKMSGLIKQGAVAGAVLIILLVVWLSSRRKRKAEPEATYEDGGDLPIFPPEPAEPAVDPEQSALMSEMAEAAARRRAFVALAEEQPEDVARVLSGWLN
jgi:flagellar M-ring protein FliF